MLGCKLHYRSIKVIFNYLNFITKNVNERAREINESAANIDSNIIKVSDFSSKNSKNIEEIYNKTIKISESMDELMEVSKINESSIFEVDSELKKFKT